MNLLCRSTYLGWVQACVTSISTVKAEDERKTKEKSHPRRFKPIGILDEMTAFSISATFKYKESVELFSSVFINHIEINNNRGRIDIKLSKFSLRGTIRTVSLPIVLLTGCGCSQQGSSLLLFRLSSVKSWQGELLTFFVNWSKVQRRKLSWVIENTLWRSKHNFDRKWSSLQNFYFCHVKSMVFRWHCICVGWRYTLNEKCDKQSDAELVWRRLNWQTIGHLRKPWKVDCFAIQQTK